MMYFMGAVFQRLAWSVFTVAVVVVSAMFTMFAMPFLPSMSVVMGIVFLAIL